MNFLNELNEEISYFRDKHNEVVHLQFDKYAAYKIEQSEKITAEKLFKDRTVEQELKILFNENELKLLNNRIDNLESRLMINNRNTLKNDGLVFTKDLIVKPTSWNGLLIDLSMMYLNMGKQDVAQKFYNIKKEAAEVFAGKEKDDNIKMTKEIAEQIFAKNEVFNGFSVLFDEHSIKDLKEGLDPLNITQTTYIKNNENNEKVVDYLKENLNPILNKSHQIEFKITAGKDFLAEDRLFKIEPKDEVTQLTGVEMSSTETQENFGLANNNLYLPNYDDLKKLVELIKDVKNKKTPEAVKEVKNFIDDKFSLSLTKNFNETIRRIENKELVSVSGIYRVGEKPEPEHIKHIKPLRKP